MAQQQQTVWRESASLILAAPSCPSESKTGSGEEHIDTDYDYKLLLLKRSDRTAIVPDQGCFPGGKTDSADEAVEWLQYLEEFGVTQASLKQLVVLGERPRILAPQGNGCYDRFFKRSHIWAREISLRITAIRETFEEVGVFLCRSKSQLNASTNYGCFRNDGFDKIYWQALVHNEPREFLRMCRELQVVPDLWGLFEWSAWASPSPVKKGFETAFFITHLTATPDILVEEGEVKEYMWHSPARLMQLYRQGELWFLPPQIYELSRFIGVKSYDVLRAFSEQRSSKGSTLYLPVGYVCTDGMVAVYPGDDFYLADPRSPANFIQTKISTVEFRAKADRVHRCEKFGIPEVRLLLNFEPLDGHLSPVKPLVWKNNL